MRLRLWRRRLTISAPRMAIRSTVPWPLRWLLGAMVLGFSGAVALWAFEFGREIAGLDRESVQELSHLRQEVVRLTTELEKAQSVANTAETVLTAERSAQTQLMMQMRDLQQENRVLRRELGFFEQLIPVSGNSTVAVRSLQGRRVDAGKVQWQVLLVRAAKSTSEFKGQLEVSYSGELRGKPWALTEPSARRPLTMRQSLRVEGSTPVPADAVVKTLSIRLMQGATAVLTQTVKVVTEP